MQRSENNHCRTVLVVVEDGDVQRLPQAPFDFEASGSRDVLEVHAPEAWRD